MLKTSTINPQTSGLEINKEIVVSTAHISLESSLKLGSGDIACIYQTYEYGWRIYTGSGTNNLPCDITRLIGLAKSYKCKWLVLDQDGDTVSYLQTYEW